MSNSLSKVQQAVIAFKKKDYPLALQLWRLAGAELGEKNFLANIRITEKILTSYNAAKYGKTTIKNEELTDLKQNSYNNLPTVSVIITTYKDNEYIDGCISSVLKQDYPSGKIQIIVSVNGMEVEYYNRLCKKYSSQSSINVIYTSQKGLPVARNFALQYVTSDYLTYLDDDDYFTSGYIKEMAKHALGEADIICGKLINYFPDSNNFDHNTYINTVLKKNSGKTSTNILENASLFSSMWAKLYKKSFILSCCSIDEDLIHTEDIAFWVDNFQNITGKIYLCDSTSEEGYVRRLTASSMSRPSDDKSFSFYITDRVKLIERFSRKMFSNISIEHKHFILVKIDAQTKHMLNYFKALPQGSKQRALEIINRSNAAFLNKSKFGIIQGIAFCHNFSPYADASAYVACKRLTQISDLYGQNISWNVFCAPMQTRQRDNTFEMFFGRYQYTEKHIIGQKTYFNEKSQYEWGKQAFVATESLKADIIYSRSMWTGSHVAAYMYKKKYPETKWYAEFSDPIYLGTDYKMRAYAKYYENEQYLNTFWRDIELYVFNLADVIIFTNANQKEFMLREHPSLHDTEPVRSKSIVMQHPTLPAYWKNLVISKYNLDTSAINIGYFGTFYPNRKGTAMLDLLKYSDVNLHIFTSEVQIDIPKEYARYKDRIYVNNFVGYFEYLNIASKMDYLYINDIDFIGDINPYLPSKLADYISVGTKIIAKINKNSPMDLLYHPNIVKYENIDDLVINK